MWCYNEGLNFKWYSSILVFWSSYRFHTCQTDPIFGAPRIWPDFCWKSRKKSGHFQFSPKTYIKIRQNPCIFVLQGLNLSFRKWFSDPWIWYLEKFSTRKLYIFGFIPTNDVDHEFDDRWKKPQIVRCPKICRCIPLRSNFVCTKPQLMS